MGMVVCFGLSNAQNAQVATLSHDGNIQVFYGTSALHEAYEAANDGDVITLSSGSFMSTDITKSVTIRGAGMEADATVSRTPTIIYGDFTVGSSSNDGDNTIVLEGLYHNSKINYGSLKDLQILKCRLCEIGCMSNSKAILTFINCRITDELRLYYSCTATCINSVIIAPYNYGDDSSFSMDNCIIFDNYQGSSGIRQSIVSNSIIIPATSYSEPNSSNTFFNCVVTNNGGNNQYFNKTTNNSNKYTDYSDLFKTFRGTYADDETFELTDAAKTNYLGTDGNEIGLYGGMIPYDPTPTNPQITKFVVAPKSTIDGKLSIDITVDVNQ